MPLPKKRKTIEADVTPKIIQHFEMNYPNSVALEIKVEKGKVSDHQQAALDMVALGTFSHKIRDTGRNPFDAFILKDAHAFIVRYYPKTRTCVATRVGYSSPVSQGQITFTI